MSHHHGVMGRHVVAAGTHHGVAARRDAVGDGRARGRQLKEAGGGRRTRRRILGAGALLRRRVRLWKDKGRRRLQRKGERDPKNSH